MLILLYDRVGFKKYEFYFYNSGNIGFIFGNFLLNIGEVFNESDVPVSKMVLSWGSVLCIVLLLNGYTQKFKFVGLGDGIAGAVFLSFMFGLKDPHLFYRELMGLCLILIVNIRLISLHNTPKNLLREFEIGLLLGLVMIISPGFLVVGIMFLIGLTLVVSFTWRDFLAPVLGVFWVFLIKYCYHFVFEEGPINEFFQLSISLPVFDFNWNIEMIEWMVLSLFVCMIFLRIFKVIEKEVLEFVLIIGFGYGHPFACYFLYCFFNVHLVSFTCCNGWLSFLVQFFLLSISNWNLP